MQLEEDSSPCGDSKSSARPSFGIPFLQSLSFPATKILLILPEAFFLFSDHSLSNYEYVQKCNIVFYAL